MTRRITDFVRRHPKRAVAICVLALFVVAGFTFGFAFVTSMLTAPIFLVAIAAGIALVVAWKPKTPDLQEPRGSEGMFEPSSERPTPPTVQLPSAAVSPEGRTPDRPSRAVSPLVGGLVGAVIATAILATGAAIAWSQWGRNSDEGGDKVAATRTAAEPEPTPKPTPLATPPARLTATEAEVVAKRYLDQSYGNANRPASERISVDCTSRELNDVTREWLVACFASAGPGMGFELVLAINAQNGEVRFP